jgi:hypothetical protein
MFTGILLLIISNHIREYQKNSEQKGELPDGMTFGLTRMPSIHWIIDK